MCGERRSFKGGDHIALVKNRWSRGAAGHRSIIPHAGAEVWKVGSARRDPFEWSVVVAAAADGVAHRPQDHERRSDQQKYDPDGPEDRNLKYESENEKKAHNKIDEVGGKLKEVVGKFTGDEGTENEGKFDQMKANLRDAGEKVKDAFKE